MATMVMDIIRITSIHILLAMETISTVLSGHSGGGKTGQK